MNSLPKNPPILPQKMMVESTGKKWVLPFPCGKADLFRGYDIKLRGGVPSREWIHIPPNGKFGESSTQICQIWRDMWSFPAGYPDCCKPAISNHAHLRMQVRYQGRLWVRQELLLWTVSRWWLSELNSWIKHISKLVVSTGLGSVVRITPI